MPAIHIHNRKQLSNLSHNSQTIYQPPETSRQPNRAILRRPIREPDRDTWCLRLSCTPHVDPHVPMSTQSVRCHSVQVQSDLDGKYNTQRLHEIVHLLQMYQLKYRKLTQKYVSDEIMYHLELCAFALKGEHNVYSLVPNIAVCMYIYILIPSCSQPAVGSNIVKITRISGHFRSICNFFFDIFDKMAAFGHFGCPKFTLDFRN